MIFEDLTLDLFRFMGSITHRKHLRRELALQQALARWIVDNMNDDDYRRNGCGETGKSMLQALANGSRLR